MFFYLSRILRSPFAANYTPASHRHRSLHVESSVGYISGCEIESIERKM
jgi:hypothetical protein